METVISNEAVVVSVTVSAYADILTEPYQYRVLDWKMEFVKCSETVQSWLLQEVYC